MNKKEYDLVIIGGGPAGTPLAMEYAKLNPNKKVLLVDSIGKLGGECLFQGCIPSKIMEATAKEIHNLKNLKDFGIELNDSHYSLVWEKIKKRKEDILKNRAKSAQEDATKIENLELKKATASFENKNELLLNNEEIIIFKKALIATGSRSFIPKYEGNGSDKIWTNLEFFANMELPKSMSIIGTGAIAIEFSMILATLGVKIDIFGRSNKILSNIDKEAQDFLHSKLESTPNITLHLESNIQKVDFENDIFEITYNQNGENKTINSHKILSAAGRIPNIEKLNLEKANVSYTKKGIQVNKNFQTSNSNIYANGDVVEGFPKFAHTAVFGAHTIAQNLFLGHNYFSVDYDINSWVLFSMPNVAMAGISEKESRNRNLDVIIDKFEFSTEAKSQIEEEDYGYLKFIVEKKSNIIIGISIMHEQANTLAGEASLIVANKMTLKDIISSIHPHPTISESYVMLAKKMMATIMKDKLQDPLFKTLINIQRWI